MDEDRIKFLMELASRLAFEGAMSHADIAHLINALIMEFQKRN